MPAPNTIECRHTRVEGAVTTESLTIYSEDTQCRYLLERIWNPDLPVLMFVMLNPSSATVTSNNDDRAVTTCENRARNHHLVTNNHIDFRGMAFGGVYVTNIFVFMETELNREEYENSPTELENHRVIAEYARIPNTTVVCAWGDNTDSYYNDDVFSNHAARIKTMLRATGVSLNYFGLTNQQPAHVNRLPAHRNFSEWPRDL